MAREGLMPRGGDIDVETEGENKPITCRGEKGNGNFFLVFIMFLIDILWTSNFIGCCL